MPIATHPPRAQPPRPGRVGLAPPARTRAPMSARGPALAARSASAADAIHAGGAVPPELPGAASSELREMIARAEARAGL